MSKRFMFWSPEARHWRPRIWFGGDEYGNPSIVFTWFASIIFFYGRVYQDKVELPEWGECRWVDHVFYDTTDEDYARFKAAEKENSDANQ